MARIIAGLGSSHASTFLDPNEWETFRARVRTSYQNRYNDQPPEQKGVQSETLDGNLARYTRISTELDELKTQFDSLNPDLLIVIGDDQNENYTDANLPQFCVYTGQDFICRDRQSGTEARHQGNAKLARWILERGVEADFDIAYSASFPNDALMSHAHTQVIARLDPEGRVPVNPLFVNAIHVPAPSPRRCYAFGQMLGRVLDSYPEDLRVVLYASGGWSHFTAGFPWRFYQGKHTIGAIDQEFDESLLELLTSGRASDVTKLTSDDLTNAGDVEFRSWIVMLGAIGDRKPEHAVYEPFYRAIMGMAAAHWDLRPADERVAAGARG